jgi:putative restriction endonuclease
LEVAASDLNEPLQKKYVERIVRERVHQPTFRARVIAAYDQRCTVCVLKHPQLLDAAHITPDSDTDGEPSVTNGMSLCKIHHAAYDENFLGVTPDYRVVINDDLLAEVDGPMLRHGLQEMHGRTFYLPRSRRSRPDQHRLQARYEEFLAG